MKIKLVFVSCLIIVRMGYAGNKNSTNKQYKNVALPLVQIPEQKEIFKNKRESYISLNYDSPLRPVLEPVETELRCRLAKTIAYCLQLPIYAQDVSENRNDLGKQVGWLSHLLLDQAYSEGTGCWDFGKHAEAYRIGQSASLSYYEHDDRILMGLDIYNYTAEKQERLLVNVTQWFVVNRFFNGFLTPKCALFMKQLDTAITTKQPLIVELQEIEKLKEEIPSLILNHVMNINVKVKEPKRCWGKPKRNFKHYTYAENSIMD